MKEFFEIIEMHQKMINTMSETISEITSTLKTQQQIIESIGNSLKSQAEINESIIQRIEDSENMQIEPN